jgi:hypothetical protein
MQMHTDERRRMKKLLVIAIAVLAVAAAGGAVAATGLGSPREDSNAILDDAAKQLGVDSAKLRDALKQAMANRIDAAVAAGRLTKAQGDAIKERMQSDEFPLLGARPGFGHHGPGLHHGPFGAKLDAAAEYLGLTDDELRAQLEAGKSLADVAKTEGKSVDGLVDALVAAAKSKLDAAVERGDLSRAQADEMVAGLTERVTDLVNGRLPTPRMMFGRGGPDRDAALFAPSVGGAPA